MSFSYPSGVSPLIHAIESFDVRKPKITINEEVKMAEMLHALLKKLTHLYASVSRTSPEIPVDGGNVLVDGMLELQAGIRECLGKIDLARNEKRNSLQFKIFSSLWVAQFRRCHEIAGKIRIFVLEHDADMSPPSGQGPFTNADDLIRSLRS